MNFHSKFILYFNKIIQSIFNLIINLASYIFDLYINLNLYMIILFYLIKRFFIIQETNPCLVQLIIISYVIPIFHFLHLNLFFFIFYLIILIYIVENKKIYKKKNYTICLSNYQINIICIILNYKLRLSLSILQLFLFLL